MGCGVSKLEIEEGGRGEGGEFKIIRRRSNHVAIADRTTLNKRLLEISKHSKDSKIIASSNNEEKKNAVEEKEEEDGESNDQEDEKDVDIPKNSIIYPGSPSFREYCVVPYLSANESNESSCSGPICELPHNKKKGKAKRGRMGRGLKKVRSLLSHPTASGELSHKP